MANPPLSIEQIIEADQQLLATLAVTCPSYDTVFARQERARQFENTLKEFNELKIVLERLNLFISQKIAEKKEYYDELEKSYLEYQELLNNLFAKSEPIPQKTEDDIRRLHDEIENLIEEITEVIRQIENKIIEVDDQIEDIKYAIKQNESAMAETYKEFSQQLEDKEQTIELPIPAGLPAKPEPSSSKEESPVSERETSTSTEASAVAAPAITYNLHNDFQEAAERLKPTVKETENVSATKVSEQILDNFDDILKERMPQASPDDIKLIRKMILENNPQAKDALENFSEKIAESAKKERALKSGLEVKLLEKEMLTSQRSALIESTRRLQHVSSSNNELIARLDNTKELLKNSRNTL